MNSLNLPSESERLKSYPVLTVTTDTLPSSPFIPQANGRLAKKD